MFGGTDVIEPSRKAIVVAVLLGMIAGAAWNYGTKTAAAGAAGGAGGGVESVAALNAAPAAMNE
jgi:hypothetical protein